jgi:hypothetical protein
MNDLDNEGIIVEPALSSSLDKHRESTKEQGPKEKFADRLKTQYMGRKLMRKINRIIKGLPLKQEIVFNSEDTEAYAIVEVSHDYPEARIITIGRQGRSYIQLIIHSDKKSGDPIFKLRDPLTSIFHTILYRGEISIDKINQMREILDILKTEHTFYTNKSSQHTASV